MESRQASVRQTTSAGYRLPDTGSAQLGSASSASCSKLLPGAQATQNRPPLGSRDEGKQRWGDAVGQDRVWREYVEAERRGGKRWEIKRMKRCYQNTRLLFQAKFPIPPAKISAAG
ncbi:hypothetical protein FKM82_023790 [Ascaphus truei]